MNYYVYRHIRLDKNEPFYIGIGHNKLNEDKKYKRAYTKHRKSSIWNNIVKKTDFIVEIIFDEQTKESAIIKEWKSAAEINKVLGYSSISRACSEKTTNIRNRGRRTAYQYYWEYKKIK